MTTKKLIIIIGSVVAGIVLLIAIFVGAILGIVFYSINQSQATATAKSYLQNNEKLKRDIGKVTDFGAITTGSINSQGSAGEATLYIKVIGERQTVHAQVDLMYQNGRDWRVTGASYKNSAGQTINLLEEYEPQPPTTPEH